MSSGIYLIINQRSGNPYVGQSTNILRRWAVHKFLLNKGRHTNRHLQSAWDLYGASEFSFDVLEELSPDKTLLLNAEQFWCDYFSFLGATLYNVASPTLSMTGFRHSQEFKARMSERHRGNSWALGNRHTRPGVVGRKHSQATIQKMKERTHPEEVKQKISQSTKGRIVSQETLSRKAQTRNSKTEEEKLASRLKTSESLKRFWAKKKETDVNQNLF